MKKHLLQILSVSLLFGTVSCTNLDETIYSEIAAEKYEFTESDNNSQFAPVYSSLREFYWSWFDYGTLQVDGDLFCIPKRIGVGWGTVYNNLHTHDFHAGINHFATLWNKGYQGINACNKLLDRQESLGLTESQIGELRGYRALYYYLLFDLFRNIPLDVTYYNHESGWQPEQSTPQEMWDFIVSELDNVKNSCGDDATTGRKGHVNNYVAHMILAKMYLNHNAWFKDDSDNSYYEKCIDELEYILQMKGSEFELASNYTDNFKESIVDCKEIIFGIPYEYLYAGGNYQTSLWMNTSGRATWGFTGWATGGGGALNQFLDTYKRDANDSSVILDKRFADSWIGGQQYDLNGNVILENGNPLVYTYNLRSTDNPGCYPMEGYRLVKYEIKGDDRGTQYDDIPFFRLADAMFMKAECLLRLGGYKGDTKQTAADMVTEIRLRNFDHADDAKRTIEDLEGPSVYRYGHYENTATQDEPDNICDERADDTDIELGGLLDDLGWEFLAEHHRRQDLIRFRLKSSGLKQNVYNGKAWFCKDAEPDNSRYKDIYPIPQDILNGNSKLKQNIGY